MDSNKWGKFAGISPETSPPPFAWGKRGAKHFPPPLLSLPSWKSLNSICRKFGEIERCALRPYVIVHACDACILVPVKPCMLTLCSHFGSCQAMYAYPLLPFFSAQQCMPIRCTACIFQFLSVNAGLSLLAFWTLSCNECILVPTY